MPVTFAEPVVRLGAAVLVLGILVATAFYLLASFRDYAAEDQETGSDALANLQEIHLKGDISDEEFRTIKLRTHRHPLEPSETDGSSLVDEPSPNDQA